MWKGMICGHGLECSYCRELGYRKVRWNCRICLPSKFTHVRLNSCTSGGVHHTSRREADQQSVHSGLLANHRKFLQFSEGLSVSWTLSLFQAPVPNVLEIGIISTWFCNSIDVILLSLICNNHRSNQLQKLVLCRIDFHTYGHICRCVSS